MSKVLDAWLDRTWIDLVLWPPAAIVAVLLDPSMDRETYNTLLEVLISTTGTLLGLGALLVTLLFTVTDSERLDALKKNAGRGVGTLASASLGGLAIALVLFVLCFVLIDTAKQLQLVLLTGGVTVAGLRFARLWWLVDLVIRTLSIKPAKEQGGYEAPEVKSGDYRVRKRKQPPETRP